ncbi:hypothetical protein GGI15_004145 [Coemansia interrupta]|uniref:Uncharacterized protein n=1 Tax=Coemansia interrupta TaxID=1126814 RepID=A0A9W8H406_9FUNG|nr:hypothetical protein GGI15_004145 [Coemansia interrupta]
MAGTTSRAPADQHNRAGVALYQGLHLPPGLRHATNPRLPMHRRDIPYGGVITFGTAPPTIVQLPQPQPPQPPKALANRPRLGLVDLNLDLHV